MSVSASRRIPFDLDTLTAQRPAVVQADVQIQLRQVHKTYRSGHDEIHALKGIDLAIHRGEILGIIGRSGAGKSSLIRTLNRLESVTEGAVLVDGQDLAALSWRELMLQRRRIGMIFQHFNLLNSRTVLENLALPMQAAGIRDRRQIEQRANELLQLVGLENKGMVYPARLSGGQKQRVGIARALMLNPSILLCDEATSALDPETTHSILELLRDIRGQLGLTIVLITHEMSVVAEICDRVAVMQNGTLVELGSVTDVFRAPAHTATQALLAPLHRMIRQSEAYGHVLKNA